MNTVLFAWIGTADLRASQEAADAGLGPIGQAITVRSVDALVLLSDHDKKTTDGYLRWAKDHTDASVTLIKAKLSAPTHFGEIYEQVIRCIEAFHKQQGSDWQRVYHLSPGTPAMAAVWIIVAKTRFCLV